MVPALQFWLPGIQKGLFALLFHSFCQLFNVILRSRLVAPCALLSTLSGARHSFSASFYMSVIFALDYVCLGHTCCSESSTPIIILVFSISCFDSRTRSWSLKFISVSQQLWSYDKYASSLG